MSVTAQIALTATVTEVLEGNPDSSSAANRTVTHSLFNVAKTLSESSDPPAYHTANFLQVGGGDIDLTALVAANGVLLDGTDSQVLYCRITNLGDNEATIQNGASNGHSFWGTGEVPIAPGGSVVQMPLASELIDATHKTWTLTAGGTDDDTFQISVILGGA